MSHYMVSNLVSAADGEASGVVARAAETPAAATLSEALRDGIMRGELVPNQRLIESDLVDQYGVSRGAVRTALQKLAAEGLVDHMRNKGARVRSVSIEEAIEITEVR